MTRQKYVFGPSRSDKLATFAHVGETIRDSARVSAETVVPASDLPAELRIDDEKLITQVARGDRNALGFLYDRHARRFLGFAHWMGLTGPDAQDIVHDVFMEVWQCAGDYDCTRGTVKTWISVRLRSRIIDHLRKVERENIQIEKLDPSVPDSERGSVLDTNALLNQRLSRLSFEQREVIVLAFLEGLSYAEIATRLSIPFGTVKSRLTSAMSRLRGSKRGDHGAT